MHRGAGIALIVSASALLLITALLVRPRVPKAVTDVLSALCGATVGIGGLLVLHRPISTASWVAAPVALGLLSVAHVRVLFGGSGPFRT